MAKKTQPPPSNEPTYLRVSRADAASKIEAQVHAGQDLLSRPVRSESDLQSLRDAKEVWSSYNGELLQTLFSTDKFFQEYNSLGVSSIRMNPDLAERSRYTLGSINGSITRLRAILGKLDLIQELSTLKVSSAPSSDVAVATASTEVFLVHGHNGELKQTVARLLEKQGLVVKILHELPDGGRTIIEKFEHYSGAGFAVVLHTPDDVGAARSAFDKDSTAALKGRARPNVLLEHGYFLAKLGRHRVAAIRMGDTEVPSDLSGVLYIPWDSDGAWKFKLVKEMKTAGMPVDMNLVD